MTKSYGISTVAALKRNLYPGQKWQGTHHTLKKDLGCRKIVEITSRGVAFETPQGPSWLYFPKAKDYKPHEDEQGFDLFQNGTHILTYRMVE